MLADESALVAIVPEAEPLAKTFRDRHDPSAAAGVPAHITLLYPFKAPDDIDDAVIRRLRDCFACLAPVRFALCSIAQFPDGVLYLVPEPGEPFRQLTLSIWDLFPEAPPYGGKWADIVPHLSVARIGDEERFAAVSADFAAAARGKLPVDATVSEVVLMERRAGRWKVRMSFTLGTGSAAATN